MGITYEFKLHCFKVKDTSKVDLKVVICAGENWEKNLKEYKEESRKNIERKSVTYKHETSRKNGYKTLNLAIPKSTNVIAIGNAACDCWDMMNRYSVEFYDKNRTLIKIETLRIDFEGNHFMLLVPEGTAFVNYEINYDENDFWDNTHDFKLSSVCHECKPDYYGSFEFDISELGGDCKIQ